MSLLKTKITFGIISMMVVTLIALMLKWQNTEFLTTFSLFISKGRTNIFGGTLPKTPRLSKGYNQLFNYNMSCRNVDPAMTQLVVFQNNGISKKQSLVQVLISTKDKDRKPTLCGGDFFYAVMWNSQDYSVAGRIQDFHNGTYLASFYPAWSGNATITIALVHSRREVEWFKSVWMVDNRPPLSFYQGVYQSGKMEEGTLCWIAEKENLTNNECMYANDVSLGNVVLFCKKPQKSGLVCDNLVAFRCDKARLGNLTYEMLKRTNGTALFPNKDPQVLGDGPIDYQIQESFSPSLAANLPACSEPIKSKSDSMIADGYWAAGKWISLKCQSRTWNVNSTNHCLQNKNIYIFGDSTGRLWFLSLASTLSGKVKSNGLVYDTYISAANMNLSFRFHPIRITPRQKNSLKKESFEVEYMDSFSSSRCNYILVFSFMAHYPSWTLNAFRKRVAQIKASIERLLARCPNTVVVVKGSHPMGHFWPGEHIFNSDWLHYNMNMILKDLSDNVGIFFNIWDLDLSYFEGKLNQIKVHMPPQATEQEIQLFLSHICPYS